MYKRRSYNKKKKAPRRRRTRVPRGVGPSYGTGGFKIVRKVTDLWLTNYTGSGATLVSPKSGILNVGTAVQNPVFSSLFTVPFSFEFHLNDLSQYADITNICDRYKIVNVKIKAQYNATAVQGLVSPGGSVGAIPIIKYITDADDSTVQTPDQLNAKMGLRSKTLNNGKFVTMTCTPRCAPLLYDGNISAYSIPSKPQWINASYNTVPHYAMKGYIENMDLSANTQVTSCVTFELTYTVLAKDLQ